MKSMVAGSVRGIAVAMILGTLPLSGDCSPSGYAAAQEVKTAAESAAGKYFTDVSLVNQNGQEMRLYSDLIKSKTVIIIPFFTSCNGACPVMNQNMAKIQDWLGDRLGKDALLISISVDPVTDTVPVLLEYSKRFNAKPGWYFLSGKKENVEFALTKLGNQVKAREDHNNIMIIGNEKTGLWKKAFSLAAIKELIPIVESVLNDKGEGK